MRVKLHFVRRRPDPRVAQNELQLGDRHVRRANVPDQPAVDQLLHRAPGLHEVRMDVGPGVRAARRHVATGRVEVRKGPVHQEQVESVETQVGERLLARGDYVLFAMLVVPQLRCDPKFLPFDAAADDRFERRADRSLVSIDRSAVEMPVADRRRAPTAAATTSGPTASEPNVPRPTAGMVVPVKSFLCGIATGSTDFRPFSFAMLIFIPHLSRSGGEG